MDRPAEGDRAITRKQALTAGAVLLVPLVTGCGDDESVSNSPSHANINTEPDGALRVFEWQGYDYPSFKAVKPYVSRYGKPKYTYITDPAQMITKVNSGFRVDVMHPGVQNLPAMIAFDMIEPWDMSLIRRKSQLEASFLEFGQVDGKQYLMPFDTGPNSLMYRSDRVDPGEQSYELLYDQRYKGRIAWYDSATDNLVIWGLMNGIDDPNNMTDDELAEAKKFLIAHKPLVRALWSLQTSLEADMAAGNILVAHAFGASYPPLKQKGVDVTFAWPKEGRLLYSVGYVLAKDSNQAAHAHRFVDTMLSPAAGLDLTNTFGYQHPNSTVDLSKVDSDTVKTFGLDDPGATQPPKAFLIKGQSGDRLRAYEKAWSEVKAA